MAEQFIASKQLPYVLQSTKLKNFFDATVDQWFKNENNEIQFKDPPYDPLLKYKEREILSWLMISWKYLLYSGSILYLRTSLTRFKIFLQAYLISRLSSDSRA